MAAMVGFCSDEHFALDERPLSEDTLMPAV